MNKAKWMLFPQSPCLKKAYYRTIFNVDLIFIQLILCKLQNIFMQRKIFFAQLSLLLSFSKTALRNSLKVSLSHNTEQKWKCIPNCFLSTVESLLLAVLWWILHSKQHSFIASAAVIVLVIVHLHGHYYSSIQLSRKLCLAISSTIYNRKVLYKLQVRFPQWRLPS